MLQVALLGCGRMGSRHARVIHADPGARLLAVVDPVAERAQAIANETGAAVREKIPEDADVVVIATPTGSHLDLAHQPLARGLWCLVEKPVSLTSDHLPTLQTERLVVAHVERFNPAVRAAGEVQPRFIEATRVSTSRGPDQETDVIFDLMIHDLDLLLHWWGVEEADVDVLQVTGTEVNGEWHEASARLRAPNGATAAVTCSWRARRRARTVDLYQPGSHLRLDLLRQEARGDRGPLGLQGDPADGLTAQWRAFTAAARGEGVSVPTAADGFAALRLAGRIRSAADATR